MFIGKLLINIIVVALTVYIIHSLFDTSVANAIKACGILVLIIGLMSLINGRVYSPGYPDTPAGMNTSLYSPPANKVIIDLEAQKAESGLNPEYVNHDKSKSFIFKKSNFELIVTGIILIILGTILTYLQK